MALVGFGFKVAAAPFHWWVADVYTSTLTPVTCFDCFDFQGGWLFRDGPLPLAWAHRRTGLFGCMGMDTRLDSLDCHVGRVINVGGQSCRPSADKAPAAHWLSAVAHTVMPYWVCVHRLHKPAHPSLSTC